MLLITVTATVSSKATDAATACATDKAFLSAGAGLCIGLSRYLSLPSELPLEQCNVHVSSGLYMRMSTTMALTVTDYWYCHCHVYGYWCCHWFCYGQSVHVGPCQSLSRFLSVSVSVSVRLCLFLSLIRVSSLFEAAHSAEMQRFETPQGLTYFAVS